MDTLESCDCCGDVFPPRAMAITPSGQFLCHKCLSDVTDKLVIKATNAKCSNCGGETAEVTQPCWQCQASRYHASVAVIVSGLFALAAAIGGLIYVVKCIG